MKDDLLDIATEWGEVAYDALLEEGVLRELPLISTLVSLAKAKGSISDKIFLKKVGEFVTSIGSFTADERDRFVQRMDGDKAERIGETLVLALDNVNRLKKCELMAWVFRAYVLGELKVVHLGASVRESQHGHYEIPPEEVLNKIVDAINMVSLNDLQLFAERTERNALAYVNKDRLESQGFYTYPPDFSLERLVNTGFVYSNLNFDLDGGASGIVYNATPLGYAFTRIIIKARGKVSDLKDFDTFIGYYLHRAE